MSCNFLLIAFRLSVTGICQNCMYSMQLKLMLFSQAFLVDTVGISLKYYVVVLKSTVRPGPPSVHELGKEGSRCAATLDNDFVEFFGGKALKGIEPSEAAIGWRAKSNSDLRHPALVYARQKMTQ